jgi:glyoxylase-like metal-dependent hydrolase (beta-lactamase superfamily II)
LYFDDGEHRVELVHLGVAHTHGDALAWLPKERILFTGDACVNGPYNFVGDGDIEKWIDTLETAKKLNATVICPGHGPRGLSSVLADQQFFFMQIRKQVAAMVREKKTAQEMLESVPRIRGELKSQPQIDRYVGDGLTAQVEKVYQELTGKTFPEHSQAAQAARHLHRHAHALPVA